MLFLFCTLSATLVWMLAMNHNQLVSLFSDWLNCSHYSIYDKTGQDQFHKLVVLQLVSLAIITPATVVTIALKKKAVLVFVKLVVLQWKFKKVS